MNVAVCEWLRMKERDLYSEVVFQEVAKHLIVPEDHVEKQR
jgi:hypothetical protein